MSIYLKRGYWHYDFRVGTVRHFGSTHEKDRGRALSYEAIKRTEALERSLPPQLRKTPRLGEFATQCLKDIDAKQKAGKLAEKTRKYYRNGVRLLRETPLMGLRLDQVTAGVADKLSFSTTANGNNALRTLRHILHIAEEQRLIYRAPKIRLFEDKERTAIAEPWLEELMLEHSRDPLRTAMMCLLDAFVRPADVMALRWENVLWNQNQIYIPKGKTKTSRRFIGMTSRMQSALLSRRPNSVTSGWVFPSTRLKSRHGSVSGHTLPSSLDKMFKAMKARVIAAVHETDPGWEWPEGLVLYSMKHTGLTAYSGEVGANQLKVAAAAGHTDLRTSRRYVHHSDDAASTMDALRERRLQIVERKKA